MMDYFGLMLLMLSAVGTRAQYNPHHAHRQCTRLSPVPCCPQGYPVPRVRCPMMRCPMGFTCQTHVLNRWGVCCRNTLIVSQVQSRNAVNRNTGVARPTSGVMQPTCTTQSSLPCCQFGQPLGRTDCRLQRCSNGYTCFTQTSGRWAVCCPMSQQQTSRTVVMVSSPNGMGAPSPLMISGPGFSPAFVTTGPSIPQESQIIEMATPPCSSSSRTPCCPSGAAPIPGSNCRFGSCPVGSTCNVHETDFWAVCCPVRGRPAEPAPTCSRMSDVACCEAGQPLVGIQCRVQACPPGYTCNSHANNRWAVCCQESNTAVTTQTCSVNNANACCPRGDMIPGTQCRTRPCLNNQYCHSNPQGRWAVCCQEPTASPPAGVQPVPIAACPASSPTPCCSQGEPLNRAQCRTRGCPAGYTCNESTAFGWTACCLTDEPPTPVPAIVPNTCSTQSPRPCCRRGNPLQQCQFQNCPSGFDCYTHITNAWSVCCAEVVDSGPPIPVRPSPQSICSSQSLTPCCGRGNPLAGFSCQFNACPAGRNCHVGNGERWSVCCPSQNTAVQPGSQCRRQNVQPCCTIGRPVQGIDCRAQSCPFGYMCSRNTMGLWAVCCTRLTAS